MNIRDITGQKFGRLTALCFHHKELRTSGKGYRYFWLYKCDCGNLVIRERGSVGNRINSCGCLHKENPSKLFSKHHLRNHPLYKKWTSMKTRCLNKNEACFKNYGGRGIKIYPLWINNFENFYNWSISNGYKEGLTIDRIDVNGNYEPSNCRFITVAEQSTNKRNNINISYQGEIKPLSVWCKILGLKYVLIRQRIKRDHKSFEEAIKM